MRGDRQGNLVLVADDNAFVRFLVKKWLGADAEIVDVEKGGDVIDAYRRVKPDVLFLDIHLPGMSGKDVLRKIMDVDPSAFVVMISADSKRDNVMGCMHEGAKAFMTKPFTRQTLKRHFHLCPTLCASGETIGEINVPAMEMPLA